MHTSCGQVLDSVGFTGSSQIRHFNSKCRLGLKDEMREQKTVSKPGCKKPEGSGRKPGRPKGALNRGRAAARDIMNALNIDPLEALLRIAKSRKTPLALKLDALKSAAKFCHPTLATTAVQVTGKDEGPIVLANFQARLMSDPVLNNAAELLQFAMLEAADSVDGRQIEGTVIDVPSNDATAPDVQPPDSSRSSTDE